MEERQFRIILSVLASLAAMVVAIGVASLVAGDRSEGGNLARDTLQLVGFSLLTVSAIGLWSWRPWGFWTLGLATAVTLVATLPDGLFPAVWRSFLHLTTLLLIAEHYFARKEEQRQEEEHRSDHSH